MRDYPSVPNVFRVASSHSVVDTDIVVACNSNSDIKTTNANLPAGQLRQQKKSQHQHQQQHQQNGNISGQQQQQLVKYSISSAAITTPALSHVSNANTVSTITALSASNPTATATSSLATSAVAASSPSGGGNRLKTFATKNVAGDNLMHNHSSQRQHQQQQQYKLTTHASIERPQYLRASQLYLQSPYATLPRNTNTSQSSLSLHSANGDIYAQQLQQQQQQQQHLQQFQQQLQPTIRHHNSTISSSSNNINNTVAFPYNRTIAGSTSSIGTVANIATNIATTGIGGTTTIVTTTITGNTNNSSSSTGNSSSSNKHSEHKGHTNDATMMGVINTISGSIPATGFPAAMDQCGTVSANGRTMSVASDLNASMNNSCTNLSKLNGLQHHQQQQQHQRQQHQQQQQQQHQKLQSIAATQQRDFRQPATTNTTAAVATATPTSTTIDDFTPYRRSLHPCHNIQRHSNNSGYLWIITPVAASISVAIVIAALAGPQWLFTEEKQPNANYNGTANFNVLDDGAFITRYTKSSLWIICSTVQGVETYSCIKIDYFSKDGYHPDPHDSASAIPYTVTKSCPFFLASGIVLLLSFIVFLIPTCSHQNNLYYFSAGIMFIVSGLLMLIGLIAYISILKAEIGSKLRPRSSLQPPMFKVIYGQSFFLFVFGFIATEIVGLLNIFLYISLQEVGYYSRLPCFTISNLHEKIKEGENPYNYHKKNTYKSYKHDVDKKPIDRIRHHQQNKKHQVRAQELELDTKKLLKNMSQMGRADAATSSRRRSIAEMLDKNSEAPFACRKHPNGMSSTMYLNELERRYYFEKSSALPPNKCNLHSKNLAKSLNELYLESTLPPPPPSTIRMGAGGLAGQQLQQQQRQQRRQQQQHQIQTLPRPPQQFSDTPQEFPLTRSVSTTTEIYATQNVSFAGNLSETSTVNKDQQHNGGIGGGNSNTSNQRRNVATNTRYNTDTETQTNGVVGGAAAAVIVGVGNHQQQRNSIAINNTKRFMQQQQQQLENFYNKRQQQQQQQHFATTSSRSGGQKDQLDKHHATDDDDDDDVVVRHGDGNDDNDADEVHPQKLCGLKRGIRKTKDELFEEFCKRAGVRPKPKNIYYIANDDDEEEDGNGQNNGHHDEDVSTLNAEEGIHHKILRSKNNIRNNMQHQQRLSAADAPGTRHHGKQEDFRRVAVAGGSGKTLENNRIYVGGAGVDTLDVVDMDAVEGVEVCLDDGDDVDADILRIGNVGEHDEHGFKKMTENEDHLYVIDDNIHLMPQSAIRNGRRASMYVEPHHLRRLNSNLSLHALYAPRPTQKGMYDNFETQNSNEYAFPPATHPAALQHYMTRDFYGGSQNRLHHDYHQQQQHQQQSIYQNRTTLPRAMVKRNADSQDSIASAGMMASATQLHNIYSASQQRLSTLMMQQQQQQQQQQLQHQQLQQQQNRYLTLSREQELYNSRYGLHKSNEELNRQYVQQHQQQQPIYLQSHQMQYQQQPHQPQHQQQQQLPTVSANLKQPLVQWPAAIPSSPSNFSGNFHVYAAGPTAIASSSSNSNHAILTRSQSGGGNGNSNSTAGGNGTGPPKFQRAYAFDEQRRSSAIVGDVFDLDEIERERRRSHASLFAGLGVNAASAAVKTNGLLVNSSSSGPGVGATTSSQKANSGSSNSNRDHYDMINGTAV